MAQNFHIEHTLVAKRLKRLTRFRDGISSSCHHQGSLLLAQVYPNEKIAATERVARYTDKAQPEGQQQADHTYLAIRFAKDGGTLGPSSPLVLLPPQEVGRRVVFG